MSFDVTTTIQPEYLRVGISGEFSIPALFELIERVNNEARAAERSRVLVDALTITGLMSDADRYLGGKRSAEVFGSAIKVAILIQEGSITKMAEVAAANRGTKLLVTSSEEEALEWLLKS